jgi:hypothetical protein
MKLYCKEVIYTLHMGDAVTIKSIYVFSFSQEHILCQILVPWCYKHELTDAVASGKILT